MLMDPNGVGSEGQPQLEHNDPILYVHLYRTGHNSRSQWQGHRLPHLEVQHQQVVDHPGQLHVSHQGSRPYLLQAVADAARSAGCPHSGMGQVQGQLDMGMRSTTPFTWVTLTLQRRMMSTYTSRYRRATGTGDHIRQMHAVC